MLQVTFCHCEERSDEAIPALSRRLLPGAARQGRCRFARNDRIFWRLI
jgi:hypothetical protein